MLRDDSMFLLTRSPEKAPDTPCYVTIAYERGNPVALDGVAMSPAALLTRLNDLGGEHGVGRVDLVENRFVGMKSRGAYETPGGTLIIHAHRELEALCLDRDTAHYKQHVALQYAEMLYNGLWFTPLRRALDAFIDSTQQTVTGEVRLRLYRGSIEVLGRTSPFSLYAPELASFTMGEGYDPKDSRGFINLIGLPIEARSVLESRTKQLP